MAESRHADALIHEDVVILAVDDFIVVAAVHGDGEILEAGVSPDGQTS